MVAASVLTRGALTLRMSAAEVCIIGGLSGLIQPSDFAACLRSLIQDNNAVESLA
jgi:hypothetical protein